MSVNYGGAEDHHALFARLNSQTATSRKQKGATIVETKKKSTAKVTKLRVVSPGSPPDVDSDLNPNIRDNLLEHLRTVYGEQNVASISTYTTFAPAGAFKKLCTLYQIPFAIANKVSKTIPEGTKRISELLDTSNPAGEEFRRLTSGDEWKKVLEGTIAFEGRIYAEGIHACGTIISAKPISKFSPLVYRKKENTSIPVTQWEYKNLEALGFIKMDLLGLDTIAIIQQAVKYCLDAGVPVDRVNMSALVSGSLDDPETLKLFAEGRTDGIFQFSNPQVKALLRDIKPESVQELGTITALYRPGPMASGSHTAYARRKQGKEEITLPAKEFYGTPVETILMETQGLLVYQEQAMRIAAQGCGMTLVEADTLRSAMGKKKIDVMNSLKPKFIAGGVKHMGVSEASMETLWEAIRGFAEYGFNACLRGDTMVLTETGEERLEDLFSRFVMSSAPIRLYSRDTAGKYRLCRVKRVVKSGVKELWRIVTESGRTLCLTENHRLLTAEGYGTIRDGLVTVGKYVVSRFVEEGKTDSFDKIVEMVPPSSRDVSGVLPAMTYDIEMEDGSPSNFVANGIVSHNSHAVAYAINAYLAGYLKAHFPAAFFAAVLKNRRGHPDEVNTTLLNMRQEGIEVLPPDVMLSDVDTTPSKDLKSVRLGLSSVKKLSVNVAEEIVRVREKSGFIDPADFYRKLKHAVKKDTFLFLAAAGGFDSLGYSRHAVVSQFAGFVDAEQKFMAAQERLASKSQGLFSAEANVTPPFFEKLPEWELVEKAKMEATSLGVYVSVRPLQSIKKSTLLDLSPEKIFSKSREPVSGVVSVYNYEKRKTKRGVLYEVVLDDGEHLLKCRFSRELTAAVEKHSARRKVQKQFTTVPEKGKSRKLDSAAMTLCVESGLSVPEPVPGMVCRVTVSPSYDGGILRACVPVPTDVDGSLLTPLVIPLEHGEPGKKLPFVKDGEISPEFLDRLGEAMNTGRGNKIAVFTPKQWLEVAAPPEVFASAVKRLSQDDHGGWELIEFRGVCPTWKEWRTKMLESLGGDERLLELQILANLGGIPHIVLPYTSEDLTTGYRPTPTLKQFAKTVYVKSVSMPRVTQI